jgi:hypothetical protein
VIENRVFEVNEGVEFWNAIGKDATVVEVVRVFEEVYLGVVSENK